jgi:hypothetical protein
VRERRFLLQWQGCAARERRAALQSFPRGTMVARGGLTAEVTSSRVSLTGNRAFRIRYEGRRPALPAGRLQLTSFYGPKGHEPRLVDWYRSETARSDSMASAYRLRNGSTTTMELRLVEDYVVKRRPDEWWGAHEVRIARLQTDSAQHGGSDEPSDEPNRHARTGDSRSSSALIRCGLCGIVRNEDTFNLSLHQLHHCTHRFLRRPSSEDEDEDSDDSDGDDDDDYDDDDESGGKSVDSDDNDNDDGSYDDDDDGDGDDNDDDDDNGEAQWSVADFDEACTAPPPPMAALTATQLRDEHDRGTGTALKIPADARGKWGFMALEMRTEYRFTVPVRFLAHLGGHATELTVHSAIQAVAICKAMLVTVERSAAFAVEVRSAVWTAGPAVTQCCLHCRS